MGDKLSKAQKLEVAAAPYLMKAAVLLQLGDDSIVELLGKVLRAEAMPLVSLEQVAQGNFPVPDPLKLAKIEKWANEQPEALTGVARSMVHVGFALAMSLGPALWGRRDDKSQMM